uniref:POU domain protein n=1 Tax=Callorhinchus milii TaxID=7868 RepID=A0A4W3GCJ9_CALMI
PPPTRRTCGGAGWGGMGCLGDMDADPRDLEAFAERFKQRRIKLGVTQADVGSALANLKIPGVGSLSQSTICRFESLTLSHNNMIALKPILQAWLEEAEKSHREKLNKPELFNGAEKKRKRTSIAAPEKRSLEAYFAIQPRPSSEKIAAIAEKLDLKKNVVRVWFCNQRQKQKRMKYSADIHAYMLNFFPPFPLPPPPIPDVCIVIKTNGTGPSSLPSQDLDMGHTKKTSKTIFFFFFCFFFFSSLKCHPHCHRDQETD